MHLIFSRTKAYHKTNDSKIYLDNCPGDNAEESPLPVEIDSTLDIDVRGSGKSGSSRIVSAWISN